MPCAFKCIILCPGSGSVLAQTCGAVNDITLIIMSERDLHAELRALELSTMRVGLIGLGAINTVVARMLCVDDKVENAALVAVLCRNVQNHVEKSSWLPRDLQLTDSMDAFLTAGCDVVVEAAGQPAVREYGEVVLRSGAHFLVTSTGALADEEVQRRLEIAARS